ncbi:MAG: ferritin-like domain-containing protein [Deltaproteobacteria bacterium]|nr:ferritin-like domain-containing protein [Deltaproteobacteria bacterium]
MSHLVDAVRIVKNLAQSTDVIADASRSHNVKVMLSMLGPAARGFLLQKGKGSHGADIRSPQTAHFVWDYTSDLPALNRLYEAAKRDQWNSTTALDWSTTVDPFDEDKELVSDAIMPLNEFRQIRTLDKEEKRRQKHGFVAWLLSQFLHGEQGALFAACQVTEAVPWIDGKLYGSTQVVDEGRHVEVFHRYLHEKLEKQYQINDNLYVIIDALMSDSRWDMKFLGMQIMIEGLALGAFQTIRQNSKEPLLKELLKYVITDEARHVHYGVVALGNYYKEVLDAHARKEREDWAYEVTVLLRNRFLAHELYDEYYGHLISRRRWNQIILGSAYMSFFRETMFKRIIPNLRKIGLLPARLHRHYEALGLMQYATNKDASELTAADLLDDRPLPRGAAS